MLSSEQRDAVLELLADVNFCLDSDDLENWVECFEEEATYRVLSRENVARNLPLPLFICENKNMMRDRVLSLRKANVTNPHRDCHVASMPKIRACADGLIEAQSTYALYQTNNEGSSRLFSVGMYKDKIRLKDGGAKFLGRDVVVDMFSVPTMLSTPI
jgi:anthranilate 1,2-dioxygenase small subunit